MAFYVGDRKVSKMYLGDREIKKAYLGDTLVFGAEEFSSRLPKGYTELEYVTSDGDSLHTIDTGISSFADSIVTISAAITTAGCVFYTDATGGGSFTLYRSGTSVVIGYGASSKYTFSGKYSEKAPYTYIFDFVNNRYKFGTSSYESFKTTNIKNVFASPLKLFKGSINAVSNSAKTRIYSFDVETSSSYVMQLVPCENTDGTAGLYDIVGKEFYTCEGLTPGPEI